MNEHLLEIRRRLNDAQEKLDTFSLQWKYIGEHLRLVGEQFSNMKAYLHHDEDEIYSKVDYLKDNFDLIKSTSVMLKGILNRYIWEDEIEKINIILNNVELNIRLSEKQIEKIEEKEGEYSEI